MSWLSYSLIPQFHSWRINAVENNTNLTADLNPAAPAISHQSNSQTRLIEGYVVTQSGKPVSGITLTIASESSNSKYHKSAIKKTESNEQGYFQINTEQPGDFSIVTDATYIYKSSTSYVDKVDELLRIELDFQERISVSGRVMDIYGIPVQGAAIYCNSKNTISKTDGEGNFNVQVMQSNFSNPRLTVIRGGYVPVELILHEQHYADKNGIEITLEPSIHTMTLQGWIGDTSGFGLSGQRIYMSSLDIDSKEPNIEDHFAYSDIDGRFEFEGIFADSAYLLEVYPTITQGKVIVKKINTSSNMESVSITVESIKLDSLAGIITDLDLNPLPNIQINISSKVSTNYSKRIRTNDAGEFFIEQFPIGPMTFHTSRLPYLAVLGIEHMPSERQQIKVPVDYGWTAFSGRISSIDGNPVAFAIVELRADFQLDKVHSSSSRIAFTDDNGVFEFKNVGKGLHSLSVISRGHTGLQTSYYIDDQSMVENITLD